MPNPTQDSPKVPESLRVEVFIEAFFDRWEDWPPDEVREVWERDLTAAFEKAVPHVLSALLSDEAIDAFWKAFEVESLTVDDRVRAGFQAAIEQVGGAK